MRSIEVEDCNSEKTTKGVAELGTRVENGCAKGELLPVVEERKEEDGTREEHGFNETKEESTDQQMAEGLDCGHKTRYHTP